MFIKKIDAMRTGVDDEDQKLDDEKDAYKRMTVKILNKVVTRYPSLEIFDEKIAYLTTVKRQIAEMKQSVDIGWLRVNSKPLITELEKTIEAWIQAYTSFILINTMQQISNINAFIHEVTEGIKVVPKSSETASEKAILRQVMTHLRDVKMIKDLTIQQIDPMK